MTIRKVLAIFWALLAMFIPYAVMEALRAPSWLFFPIGAGAGMVALITFLAISD